MRLLVICFGLLVIGSQQVKAAGFALFEASVRVSGMMGAYVADGRDVSTIFFNPAGLAQLSGFQFQAGAAVIAPRTSFRGPYPYSVQQTDAVAREIPIPHMYASYQVMENFTVGLGVYIPFGLGSKWDRGWVGSGISTETGLQTLVVAPSAAYGIELGGAGTLMIGGSLKIGVLGSALLEREVTDFVSASDQAPMIRLEGEVAEPYYGFDIGAIYKLNDMISFGFAYKSELELNLEGDSEFTSLPASQFPETTGSLSITTPASFSVGVSVKPIEDLTVNLDYIAWGWSSYDSLNIDFETETALLQDLKTPRLYEDVYQIRFGAEYNVKQVDGLIVRGGIQYDKNPVPDATIDPTLPDADRIYTSIGASYYINESVGLNLYYTFIRNEERLADQATFQGYYNTRTNIFGAGISLKF